MDLIPEDWRYGETQEFSHNIGLISELNLLMVPFQNISPEEEGELFHAPCPISHDLDTLIFDTLKPMGSERDLENITQSALVFKDAQDIMTRMRNLIILHYKLEHPGIGEILGGSGSLDYKIATDTAIVETLALAHQRVEGGLFEAVETLEIPETPPKIKLTKSQKEVLEKIYKACRMTTFMAHRLNAPYVRVAYLPTKVEAKQINGILGISPHKPDEVVCTYKRLSTPKVNS